MAYWLLKKPFDNWALIFATITEYKEVKIKDTLYHDYPSIEFCYPIVEYRYSFKGKHYVSNNVAMNIRDIYERNDGSEHPWSKWKEDEDIKIFVNPMQPSESIALPEMAHERRQRYMVFIIGAYASLIGFYVLFELTL